MKEDFRAVILSLEGLGFELLGLTEAFLGLEL